MIVFITKVLAVPVYARISKGYFKPEVINCSFGRAMRSSEQFRDIVIQEIFKEGLPENNIIRLDLQEIETWNTSDIGIVMQIYSVLTSINKEVTIELDVNDKVITILYQLRFEKKFTLNPER